MPRKRRTETGTNSRLRLPLPSVVDVTGRRCVCLKIPDQPEHIQAFWGFLWGITRWHTWTLDGTHKAKEVADVYRQIWFDGHNRFWEGDCCGETDDCEPTCRDYPAHSGIIQYKPSDPFLTPNYIPPGYSHHPFSVGQSDFLPGSMDGDVTFSYKNFFENFLDFALWAVENFPTWVWDGLTDLADWLDNTETNLFPRFKVRFTGSGQVDLHLLKVPAGGLAYITLDGNPQGRFVPLTTFSLIEIESWLSGLATIGLGSMAGTFVMPEIIQMEVEGEGEHYIDVTFIPKLEVSFPELVGLGWGGGLRKVELCGVKPIIPTPPTRENTEENCIEWLNPVTREWECIAEIVEDTEMPPTSPINVSDDCGDCGDCDDCQDCDDCEECGDWDDCDDCSEGGSGTVPVITYELNPEANAFRWFIDGQPGEWIPIPTGAQGEPGADGEPGPQGEQGPQGPIGGTPDYDWLHTFDLTASNHGFTVDSGSATWTAGVGWTGNNFGSSPNIRKILTLRKDLSSARTITYLEWTVTQTFGVTANDANRLNQLRLRTGTTNLNLGEDNPGTGIHTWAGSIAGVDNLRPTIANSVFATGQNGGSVILVKLKVGGLGTDPFS